MKARIEDVLDRGTLVVLRDEAGVQDAWAFIRDQIIECVGEVAGVAAAERVEQFGLGALHEVVPANLIGALRDVAMARIRPTLLRTTVRVAREVLGIDGDFYVDDYTILRINLPYEVALEAPMDAENPGIGRMSETARAAADSARVNDPVYDPQGYHCGTPPASWAHGPHLDSWTGHSLGGVNLWWAISDVTVENSMFVFPELFGASLDPDPRSLYLRSGHALPRPTMTPLAAGELLVFNPQVLHGTHLNLSGRTRVALSTRINTQAPRFDPTCFYAREFWHSSVDLEAESFDVITRFPRAENLSPILGPAAPPAAMTPTPTIPIVIGDEGWIDVMASADLAFGDKVVLSDRGDDADGGTWLLCRTTEGVRMVGARCPHLGVPMADGFHDDTSLYCPAHAVSFKLADGLSASPVLRLAVGSVRERAGRIEVSTSPLGANVEPAR